MKTKRVRYLFILLTIAGIGIFLFLRLKPQPISNPQLRLKEEQKIFAVLLADSVYRLDESTTLGYLNSNSQNNPDLSALGLNCDWSSIFTDLCTIITAFPDSTGIEPMISRETAVDFQRNNQQSYLLQGYLPSPNNHILLSPADIQDLPDSGWFSVSRVGLNSTFTQALVLLNQVAKVNDTVGVCNQFYEILQKTDGKWTLQKEVKIVDCELPPSQN